MSSYITTNYICIKCQKQYEFSVNKDIRSIKHFQCKDFILKFITNSDDKNNIKYFVSIKCRKCNKKQGRQLKFSNNQSMKDFNSNNFKCCENIIQFAVFFSDQKLEKTININNNNNMQSSLQNNNQNMENFSVFDNTSHLNNNNNFNMNQNNISNNLPINRSISDNTMMNNHNIINQNNNNFNNCQNHISGGIEFSPNNNFNNTIPNKNNNFQNINNNNGYFNQNFSNMNNNIWDQSQNINMMNNNNNQNINMMSFQNNNRNINMMSVPNNNQNINMMSVPNNNQNRNMMNVPNNNQNINMNFTNNMGENMQFNNNINNFPNNQDMNNNFNNNNSNNSSNIYSAGQYNEDYLYIHGSHSKLGDIISFSFEFKSANYPVNNVRNDRIFKDVLNEFLNKNPGIRNYLTPNQKYLVDGEVVKLNQNLKDNGIKNNSKVLIHWIGN